MKYQNMKTRKHENMKTWEHENMKTCKLFSEKNNESWHEIIKLMYLKIQVKFKKGYFSY